MSDNMSNDQDDRLAQPTVKEIRVQARRERVKALLARRMSAAEIAQTVGVCQRTIKADFSVIRTALAASLTTKDAYTVASDLMERAATRQRELWALFDQLTPPAVKGKLTTDISNAKLAILKELRAEARDEIDILQKLGIVYQAPKDIRVGFAALDVLTRVSEDNLQRLARAPVEDFVRLLGECVGAEEVERLIASGDGTETDTKQQ